MDLEFIIKALDQEEKIELARMLHQDLNVPNINPLPSVMNLNQKLLCPHCGTDAIYGHGTYKGRKRYKCRDCKKTFNEHTGTAISGIKKVDKFEEYMALLVESVTIRKASSTIGVNMKTIFDWRHKLLSSLAPVNSQSFSGIVEGDDKQMKLNNTDSGNLNRNRTAAPGTEKEV